MHEMFQYISMKSIHHYNKYINDLSIISYIYKNDFL